MLSGARLVRLLGPDCTVLAAHGGFCFGAALVGTKEGINLLRLKYTLGCPYPGQPRHCFIIDFIQHNAGAGGGCSVVLTGAGGGCSMSYLPVCLTYQGALYFSALAVKVSWQHISTIYFQRLERKGPSRHGDL